MTTWPDWPSDAGGDLEIPLPGGNVGGAVRVGDTVRRAVGPWTPAVHRLLARVAEAGLRATPRVHGFDDEGREVLDFLPGRIVDIDSEAVTDAQLASIGRWTRDFHDAVAGHPLDGPWRFVGVADATTVAHNDLAPYNLCFDGDELAGVFDWDIAGPSTPALELAHIAWTAVPLLRDVEPVAAARRLTLLSSSYAARPDPTGDPARGPGPGPGPAEILAAVAVRVRQQIDGIRAAAAAGDEGMQHLMVVADEPERTERSWAAFVPHLPAIEDALHTAVDATPM